MRQVSGVSTWRLGFRVQFSVVGSRVHVFMLSGKGSEFRLTYFVVRVSGLGFRAQ